MKWITVKWTDKEVHNFHSLQRNAALLISSQVWTSFQILLPNWASHCFPACIQTQPPTVSYLSVVRNCQPHMTDGVQLRIVLEKRSDCFQSNFLTTWPRSRHLTLTPGLSPFDRRLLDYLSRQHVVAAVKMVKCHKWCFFGQLDIHASSLPHTPSVLPGVKRNIRRAL